MRLTRSARKRRSRRAIDGSSARAAEDTEGIQAKVFGELHERLDDLLESGAL